MGSNGKTIRDNNTYVPPQNVLAGVASAKPLDVVVVYRDRFGSLQIASCTGNLDEITKVLNAASKWLDESQYHPKEVKPIEFGEGKDA